MTHDTPDLAIFDRVREQLTGAPELALETVAERAGLPTQILREVFAAMHWEDRPAYDERDVEYARAIAEILDHYPLDAVVRTIRTRYRALTSVVISDIGTVRDEVILPALAAGASEQDLQAVLGATADELIPLVTSQLTEDYRHILLRLLDSEALARGVRLEDGREVELAVGFVDVVGYTALSGQMDPAGLDHVLASFEDLVTAAVARTEDVLLVKFVGDAAMLVAPDPVELTALLLALVTDRTRLAEAPRRAGIAHGGVLVREGDYYGPIPNLAARLTDHAKPWSLLAAEELAEHLDDDFELTTIPEVSIHGVGEREPLRVRAGEEGSDGGADDESD